MQTFRSRKHFEKPNEFDPTRWLAPHGHFVNSKKSNEAGKRNGSYDDNERKNGNSEAEKPEEKPYYPFSIGARSCPGSQISACVAKFFIARMLQDYKLVRQLS